MPQQVDVIITNRDLGAHLARQKAGVRQAILDGVNFGIGQMEKEARKLAPLYRPPPHPAAAVNSQFSIPGILKRQVYGRPAVFDRGDVAVGKVGVQGSFPGGTVPWAEWVESGTGEHHVRWRIVVQGVGNSAAIPQGAAHRAWDIPSLSSFPKRTLPPNKIPTSRAQVVQTGLVYPRALIITPALRGGQGGAGYVFYRPGTSFDPQKTKRGVRYRKIGSTSSNRAGMRRIHIHGQKPQGYLHKAVAKNQGAMRERIRSNIAKALGIEFRDLFGRFDMKVIISDFVA